MNKPHVVGVMASQLGVKNFNITVYGVFLLFGFKVTVHYVKRGPSSSPKHASYHDLYILMWLVSFYHLWVPFVLQFTKTPDLFFPRTPLRRALI